MTRKRVAWLVGVAGALFLAAATWFVFRPRPTPSPTPRALPVIAVEAVYPGADARVVADTIAAPVEQQINGVEGMVQMVSRSGDDGTYTLHVVFKPGTDLNIAQVLVQNRLALAMPVLPDRVRDRVRAIKRLPGLIAIATLSSPGGRFDEGYLGQYADTVLRDELARVPGVAEVACIARREDGVRITIDPARLAGAKVTADELIAALRKQPTAAEVEKVRKVVRENPLVRNKRVSEDDVRAALRRQGTPAEVAKVAGIVLKTDPDGRSVRLRDVARVESRPVWSEGFAVLDGMPVAAVALAPLSVDKVSELREGLQARLTTLRKQLPKGLALDLSFDFTPNLEDATEAATPGYLLVDVQMPDSNSAARTQQTLGRCAKLLRQTAAVKEVLALSANPFDLFGDHACLLVRLAPAEGRPQSDDLLRAVRDRLNHEIPDAVCRLRDLSGLSRFPPGAYPIDLALYDMGDRGSADFQRVADDLARQLERTGKLTDVLASRALREVPRLVVDPPAPGSPLRVRFAARPRAIGRFNLFPMVAITANPAPGVSLTEARELCEAMAAKGLPRGCRVGWRYHQFTPR